MGSNWNKEGRKLLGDRNILYFSKSASWHRCSCICQYSDSTVRSVCFILREEHFQDSLLIQWLSPPPNAGDSIPGSGRISCAAGQLSSRAATTEACASTWCFVTREVPHHGLCALKPEVALVSPTRESFPGHRRLSTVKSKQWSKKINLFKKIEREAFRINNEKMCSAIDCCSAACVLG